MKKYIIGLAVLVIMLAGLKAVNGQERPRKITSLPKTISIPERTRYVLKGDGLTDDTEALRAWNSGKEVLYRGKVLKDLLQNGRFLVTRDIRFDRANSVVRYNLFIIKGRAILNEEVITSTLRTRFYENEVMRDVTRPDIENKVRNQDIIIRIQKQQLEIQKEIVQKLQKENRELKANRKYLFY